MTSLDWELVLTVLTCTAAVMGLLYKWKGKSVFFAVRAGVFYAILWVRSWQYDAAERERKERESRSP